MYNWNKISLFKYQQLELIQQRNIDDFDKVMFSICAVFDKTEYQLDNMKPKVVNKLAALVTKIMQSEIKVKHYDVIGKYNINYDPAKLTFGQYIELSHYLSNNPLQNAHKILASVSISKEEHSLKAEYFLNQSVIKIIGSIALIIERIKLFNGEYKQLFGIHSEDDKLDNDPFNKKYGWIYAASQVAEYERITLEQTYALPVRQAFHDLSFLKAKGKYELEQLKKR